MPGDPPPDSYLAWNGRRYAWPPPEGWYLATDGRWWAPAGESTAPSTPTDTDEIVDTGPPRTDDPATARPAQETAPEPSGEPSTTSTTGSDHDEPTPRPTGPDTAWSDLDGIDPKQVGRASRWQSRRRRLGGLAMFAVIAAAGVVVGLAITGRLDVTESSPTTTIPEPRRFDEAPSFEADGSDRTMSTRTGTAADPHRLGEVATVQRRPGTVAWQAVLERVSTVEAGAFDALGDDERCVAAVVEVRAEQSPPVEADADTRTPPTIEAVLDGVASGAAASCGDPAALADELDATWWIEAEPGTGWTRLFELFVVPRDTAGLPLAVESAIFAAAPLPGAIEAPSSPDGASTVDDVAVVITTASIVDDCLTLTGTATVVDGARAVVDTRLDGRLGISTDAGEIVAGSCPSTSEEIDGRVLRLAGGSSADWALGYAIGGLTPEIRLDGEILEIEPER